MAKRRSARKAKSKPRKAARKTTTARKRKAKAPARKRKVARKASRTKSRPAAKKRARKSARAPKKVRARKKKPSSRKAPVTAVAVEIVGTFEMDNLGGSPTPRKDDLFGYRETGRSPLTLSGSSQSQPPFGAHDPEEDE